MHAWRELQNAAKEKKTHPFFRAVDGKGHMYAGEYADIECFNSEKTAKSE